MPLSLADIDFALPAHCIAQAPARPRDASRLFVAPRDAHAPFAHRRFAELPQLLQAGDVLVVNRTQVMPARLRLRHAGSARAELLLCRPVDGTPRSACVWEAMGRPKTLLCKGREVQTWGGCSLRVLDKDRQSGMLRVQAASPLWPALQAEGEVPLPPYIERSAGPSGNDREDYQSLFAREPGAVAAPTASLHFTPRIVRALRDKGVQLVDVVLHVGPGTFLPIRPDCADDLRRHVMHAEAYAVPQATIDVLQHARAQKRRVIAVGTTSLRALETFAHSGTAMGQSTLFVLPGYRFAAVDGLITNFHLPKSTLLLLVSALLGHGRTMQAYQEAIAQNYRFYSYGDAMLIT